MKQIILLISLFYFGISQAQKKDIHIIELLPNETETVLESDFYIAEIIDNRIIKTNVGIAQKGLMNRKVPSDFSKSFEKELLDYLNTILPEDSSKEAYTLRINQLLISEHTTAFKETGKAIVRLDVLKKDGENDYSSLGYFSATRSKNSMDVTRKHDDRIRAVLKDCLMQFDSLDRKSIVTQKIDINRPLKAAIIDDAVNPGFFRTYMELANNNPMQDIEFRIQNRSTEDRLHLKDSSNKKIVHFAYYDGEKETLYLNASTYSGERHFIRTERFDEFLLFTDVFVNQDTVSGMSMAFGVLGILSSNERQHVMFDINTGQFYPLSKNRMRIILKNDYPKLYKKYRKDPKNFASVKEILNSIYDQVTPEEFGALIRIDANK